MAQVLSQNKTYPKMRKSSIYTNMKIYDKNAPVEIVRPHNYVCGLYSETWLDRFQFCGRTIRDCGRTPSTTADRTFVSAAALLLLRLHNYSVVHTP